MIKYQNLSEIENRGKVEHQLLSQRLVIGALRLFAPTSATTLKLKFYDKFFNYLRIIALYIVYNNDEKNLLREIPENRNEKILFDFLIHFNIIETVSLGYKIRECISIQKTNDIRLLKKMIEGERFQKFNGKILNQWAKDFYFVREIIQKYRNPDYKFERVSNKMAWERLMVNGQLDYEVRLSETLFELHALKTGKKIISPFDESYYTESGRNAFENFTRRKFIKVIKDLTNPITKPKFLDIGCGYGNYIKAVSESDKEAIIHGVEVQKSVYKEVKTTFKNNDKVGIYNTNIFDFDEGVKYDMVLLNYVLFYFTLEEKQQLIQKIKSILAPGGTILICQYYAGIEPLKYKLAKLQGELNISKKIEMFVGNKILYANALWNQSASTFAEAEDWSLFNEILSGEGFKVESITHADKFYYSLFVAIKAMD